MNQTQARPAGPEEQVDKRWLLDSARINRAPKLFEGVVRGRRFVHDPESQDALAILSTAAERIVDLADARSIPVLAKIAALPLDVVRREVAHLVGLGVLRCSEGPFGPARTPKPTAAPIRTFDVWLHITSACNLDCAYCYIAKPEGRALDVGTEVRVLDALILTAKSGGFGKIRVRYAGGEPLVRPDVLRRFHLRAIARCQEEGLQYEAAILTNGTLIDEDMAGFIAEQRISVSISIDGVGLAQDTARPMRVKGSAKRPGRDSSFAALEQGLHTYLGAGIRPYGLVTVSASNLDGLPELTRFWAGLGLSLRYSLVRDLESGASLLHVLGPDAQQAQRTEAATLLPLSRLNRHTATQLASDLLDGEALAHCIRVFSQCYDILDKHVSADRPMFFWRSHKFCDLEPRRPIRRACTAGSSYVAIDESGHASACQAALHREPALDVGEHTSLANLGATVFSGVRTPNVTCAACAYKHSCAGGCPLLLQRRGGNEDGRSPYCHLFRWVMPRLLRLGALEILVRTSNSP